jgi:hypothetical protein
MRLPLGLSRSGYDRIPEGPASHGEGASVMSTTLGVVVEASTVVDPGAVRVL